MELRVLGRIELSSNARTVAVAAARQRGLLALLVMERGRSPSSEWLIDQLWDGAPPPSAKATLQSCVYRLRKTFTELGLPIRLHTRTSGYALELPPGVLDLDRFEQAASEGRRAMEDGRLADAVAAFRSGLRLWRGEAFDGVETAAVREHADRLRERRLDVNELCLEAELAEGRPAAVADELAQLTSSYPLRESLWRLRMLALTRYGRRAEALAAYGELRRLLDDELGLEPSAAVRELYQQILTDDSALTRPQPAAASRSAGSARTIPRMLPAAVGDFTGRKAQLARLDQLMPPGASGRPEAVVISAISGMAGIGKTMLAVHWAHRVADRFPDGQLYVNLRGFHPTGQPVTPAEALRGFLDALGVPAERIPTDLDARIGLYRSLLADRQVLVVLDNARDSEQARPLLPGAPGCLVVVTSRDRLTGLVGAEVARPLLLDLLTTEESRELLARRLGADRTDAEPQAVQVIIRSCARLPLALVIAAARAATNPRFPLRVLADELAEASGGLDAFAGGDPAADVRAVFSWSYRRLSDPAARLFRLLGLHPGPDVSGPAAASLAGVPPGEARSLLAELTRAHLLTQHQPGRYTFHDLLRAYAAELAGELESDAERLEASGRLLDHYLHTGFSAVSLLEPARVSISLPLLSPAVTPERLTDHDQAKAWLAAEDAVLVAAVHHAAATGFDVHAWQLVWVLAPFHDLLGRWHEQLSMFRIALDAAARAADARGQGHARCGLGAILTRLGDYDEARPELESAIQLFQGLDDGAVEAHGHFILCAVLARQGHLDKGIAHAERAVTLFGQTDQPAMQARTLDWLGWAHAQLGEYQRALELCRDGMDLQRRLDDQLGQASTLTTLGYVHHLLGEYDRAVTSFREAIRMNRAVGSRYSEADALRLLGDTQAAVGMPEAAAESWQAALTILEELGHRSADDVRVRLAKLGRE